MSIDEIIERFPFRLKIEAVAPWECPKSGWIFSRQRYRLIAPFHFRSRILNKTVIVPTGYESDFASVPLFLPRFVLDDDSPEILYPSVIHDKLCDDAAKSDNYSKNRKNADLVLAEAMEVVGSNELKRVVAYAGVRIGAWIK